MGLKTFLRRSLLARLLKEFPMISGALKWLTDPAFAGRKRTLTAILAVLAGALRGSAFAIKAACDAHLLPAWLCAVDPGTAASWVDTLINWLDNVLVPGTDAITILMGTWALVDAKKKGSAALAIPTKAAADAAAAVASGAAAIVAAVLLGGATPAIVGAQTVEAPPAGYPLVGNQPTPDTPSVPPASLTLDLGAQSLITREEREERAVARLTLDTPLPPQHLRLAIRLEASGTQAGGTDLAFDPYNPKTFRSMQGCTELRYQLDSGLAFGPLACATWSIEGIDGPQDPRLWTAAALARIPLPNGSWLRIGGGHHGPVGGWAILGALQYPAGPGRLLVDYALPLQRTTPDAPLSWTLTTMVSVPVKKWTW